MRVFEAVQGLRVGEEPGGGLVRVTQVRIEVSPKREHYTRQGGGHEGSSLPGGHAVHNVHLHEGEVWGKVSNRILVAHASLSERQHPETQKMALVAKEGCRPDPAGGVVGGQALQMVAVRGVRLEGHGTQLLQVPLLWWTKVPWRDFLFRPVSASLKFKMVLSAKPKIFLISDENIRWYLGLDILFIEWQNGSKGEKMGLVEFSDLEPAVGSKVKEYVEAAVERVFIFFLL